MNYIILSDCCIVFQNRVASVPIDGCWVLSQFACSINDAAVDIHFHVLCKLRDVPPSSSSYREVELLGPTIYILILSAVAKLPSMWVF